LEDNEAVTVRSLDAVIGALNDAGVRYLIAGGLAVVAHGYVRFTADVDLMLDLGSDNAQRALSALESLGYRPRVPVALADFLDPATRASWVHEKHMTVFSLHSPQHPATEIDLFIDNPLDFDRAYANRVALDLGSGVRAAFVGLDDLLEMKRRAGRAVDAIDITHLEAIRDGKADA
jgi:hypothetical protein